MVLFVLFVFIVVRVLVHCVLARVLQASLQMFSHHMHGQEDLPIQLPMKMTRPCPAVKCGISGLLRMGQPLPSETRTKMGDRHMEDPNGQCLDHIEK